MEEDSYELHTIPHYPGRILSTRDRGYDYGMETGWGLEVEAAPSKELDMYRTTGVIVPVPSSITMGLILLGVALCRRFMKVKFI